MKSRSVKIPAAIVSKSLSRKGTETSQAGSTVLTRRFPNHFPARELKRVVDSAKTVGQRFPNHFPARELKLFTKAAICWGETFPNHFPARELKLLGIPPIVADDAMFPNHFPARELKPAKLLGNSTGSTRFQITFPQGN